VCGDGVGRYLQIHGIGINTKLNIKNRKMNMKNLNGQVLENERAWEQNGKIERSHIAIGAIVFCIVIAVGIFGLFFLFVFFFLKK
jgi:hypothetical protein